MLSDPVITVMSGACKEPTHALHKITAKCLYLLRDCMVAAAGDPPKESKEATRLVDTWGGPGGAAAAADIVPTLERTLPTFVGKHLSKKVAAKLMCVQRAADGKAYGSESGAEATVRLTLEPG